MYCSIWVSCVRLQINYQYIIYLMFSVIVHHHNLFLRYSATGTTSFSNSCFRCCTSTKAAVTTHATHHHVHAPTYCWYVSVAYSTRTEKVHTGLAINKISEVDGGYADPTAGSEIDGGIEEKPYSRSQVSTHQRAHAFYYAAPTICKSQRCV